MADNYGTLYVCATPIGNLKDITLRVLDIFNSCDIIAAEDTRHTIKLLNHYNIKSRLISCHEHNERKRAAEIIGLLKEGKNIALVSDAGMPGISDPGGYLIALCHENGIVVTVAPGASALVSALVLSGFNVKSFVFEGFLPKIKKERILKLNELKMEQRVIILYESPHRLKRTLDEILEHFGDRDIAIVREITKIHEEVKRLLVSEAVLEYMDLDPRGEFVLVLKGNDKNEDTCFWDNLTLAEHVNYYMRIGMSDMDAIKKTAKDRGVSKSAVYGKIKT